MALDVLLAGLFAGTVAVLVTVAIERWGGRVGGVLGTVPSTIVPAALGMAARAATPAGFAEAIHTAPVGVLLNALFLYLWRRVPPHLPAVSLVGRLGLMTALSLAAWLAGALLILFGLQHLEQAGISPHLIGLIATLVNAVAGVAACARAYPAPRGRNPVRLGALAARGVLAAVAVGGAVWLVSTPYGLVAGVASVFPAIFLTTMVSLWIAQGEAVPAGAVGPMMLGASSVAAFAMLVGYSLPLLGPTAGAAVAWVAAVGLVTVPAGTWLTRKH